VSPSLVGGYQEILVCVEVGRVLVEPYVDDLVGDDFVDDILKPFPIAACWMVQGFERRQVCLDIPFIFEGLQLGVCSGGFP
jgi:hypothetical protein